MFNFEHDGSSCSQVFYEKALILTLLESPFDKVAGLNLLKKELQRRYFSKNFAKFFRKSSLQNKSRRLECIHIKKFVLFCKKFCSNFRLLKQLFLHSRMLWDFIMHGRIICHISKSKLRGQFSEQVELMKLCIPVY